MDADDPAIGRVVELDHSQLDDLVSGVVEAGRLGVQQDGDPGLAAGGRRAGLARDESLQHSVVGRPAQGLRHRGRVRTSIWFATIGRR